MSKNRKSKRLNEALQEAYLAHAVVTDNEIELDKLRDQIHLKNKQIFVYDEVVRAASSATNKFDEWLKSDNTVKRADFYEAMNKLKKTMLA